MRRIVSKIEKEGFQAGGTFFDVFASPFGEQIRGVALRCNLFRISSHEVLPVPQMRPVIVHHVTQKAVEEIKATLSRGVWRVDAKVPFADDCAVVSGGA